MEGIFNYLGVKNIKILIGNKNVKVIKIYEKVGYDWEDEFVFVKELK